MNLDIIFKIYNDFVDPERRPTVRYKNTGGGCILLKRSELRILKDKGHYEEFCKLLELENLRIQFIEDN